MSLDGVLYSVSTFSPCLDCSDVYLVEAVCVAENTDAIRLALQRGDLPDVKCGRCGTTLCQLPLLLCGSDEEMTLWCLPGTSGFEPAIVRHLLLMLRACRQRWPTVEPRTVRVVQRNALAAFADGGAAPATTFAIPRDLWSQSAPPPLPFASEEDRREAWDVLVRAQRDLLDSAEKGIEAGGLASRDLIAGVARRLVLAHVRRFRALGERDDLAAARDAATRAMEMAATPQMRARILSDVGALATLQYERVGDAEMAREALAAYRDAVAVDPDNTVAATGLGAALSHAWMWEDDPGLLNDSIVALRTAVARSPGDGGDRAVRLNNLGSALSQRGEVRRDARDLTEAAIALTTALELTPAGSHDAAARHNNLGTVHMRAYRLGGGASTLDLVVQQFEAAIATSAERDPDLPGRQANLASALWLRGAPGDDDRASALSRLAANGRDDDPEGALLAARNWCAHAFEQEAWDEVLEAYGHALTTSDLLLERQVSTGARRTRLRVVQGLPELAAYAAGRSGDSLGVARTLEAGRARLLADAFEQVAAGVEAAREVDPRLVAHRAELIEALDRLDHSMEDALNPAERADRAADARRFRAQLTEVMAEIDTVVGVSPSPPHRAIEQVARRGPLIYVACTSVGTVASVVLGEPLSARLVWSEDLTSGVVADLQSRTLTVEGLEYALATVGRMLVAQLEPIVAMHTAVDVLTLSLPAALARLPLGAAPFCVDGDIRRLVDSHAVAYVPAAFAAARPIGAVDRGVQLGGVTNPARAGLAPLQYATAELQAAASHLPADDRDLLNGSAASVDNVISVIERCSHVHLACHGLFKPDVPLDSCLLLADGDLSLRRIRRVARATSLQLVVLSACESAQTDTVDLPDEMVGLPTALLQLGAQTVIGALWPVPDLPTYVLMERFYRHLDADGLTPEHALRVAQNWLRTATTSAVVDMLNDAKAEGPNGALVQIAGRVLQKRFAADEQPFSSPAVWAGFVAFGGQN